LGTVRHLELSLSGVPPKIIHLRFTSALHGMQSFNEFIFACFNQAYGLPGNPPMS
jgi:hypothetical protein